ncbi:hypothetical protein J416_08022 [Gracilibacillus halophilus YIM-C55.5]|uniref:Uncharacterized protein n=1 Tax=Gracilibacillus halophilus YIM-C55.5 TaxID=1308866 RepID=N4W9P6_9BACI|nr:hypothetical protein [Gracilibacillus halophilus]ENH97008.1 hypothetical protein J416_08022 [Gracilibacillus halophilus YIM-C55.5]
MKQNWQEIFGSWVVATGTFVSAIANTPSIPFTRTLQQDFKVIGNTMQGTGNALSVQPIYSFTLEDLANEVQSIGNTTIVGSLLLDFNDSTKQSLNTKGNLLQALGGGMAFAKNYQKKLSIRTVYIGFGNLLQMIGNSFQAVSPQLKQIEAIINTLGNWIQALGALMTAIGTTMPGETNH